MRYEHRGHGYRIIFNSEEDFLRCRSSYLLDCKNPDFTFKSFEEYAYRSRYSRDDFNIIVAEYIEQTLSSWSGYVDLSGATFSPSVDFNNQLNGFWTTSNVLADSSTWVDSNRMDILLEPSMPAITTEEMTEGLEEEEEEVKKEKNKKWHKPKGTIFDKIDLD